MKQELESAIVELITKTVENTGKATDFILAETPEYVQQLLQYKMITSLALFAIGIMFLVVLIGWICFCVRGSRENHDGEWITGGLFGGIIILLPTFGFCENGLVAFKIWIAPKVYLVEYAAGLIK